MRGGELKVERKVSVLRRVEYIGGTGVRSSRQEPFIIDVIAEELCRRARQQYHEAVRYRH